MGLSAEQIAEIRASYGADLPIWEQYFKTVANFLTGNFGYSIQAGVPVSQQLATNLPPTLLLASLGFVAAVGAHDRAGGAVEHGGHGVAALFLAVAALAVHLGAGVLARHHADPDLLLPARPGLGDQPRPRRAPDPAGGDACHPDLGAAGADPDAQHRRGAGPALRRRGAGQGRVAQLGAVEARGAQCRAAHAHHRRRAVRRTCWPARS